MTNITLSNHSNESNTFSYQCSAPADNVDDRDIDEPMFVTDYACDMHENFSKTEEKTSVRPGFMDIHPHINSGNQEILVCWLVEVHLKFRLGSETLFLITNLIDGFLEKRLGGSLFVFNLFILSLFFFCFLISRLLYLLLLATEQTLDMEEVALKSLGYRAAIASTHVFLVRCLKATHADKKMVQLACYILDGILQFFLFKTNT